MDDNLKNFRCFHPKTGNFSTVFDRTDAIDFDLIIVSLITHHSLRTLRIFQPLASFKRVTPKRILLTCEPPSVTVAVALSL